MVSITAAIDHYMPPPFANSFEKGAGEARPHAERAFFESLPADEGRKVAGSFDKLRRILDGENWEKVIDGSTDPLYRLQRVGEIYRSGTGATLPTVTSAYETAKSGGKYHGWYLQQLNLSDAELEKGIKSFERQIRKHRGWIDDPTSKTPDFFSLHPAQQVHLIEVKWPQDIRRQQDSIEILRGILEERKHGNI
jgi:hypothetical protein